MIATLALAVLSAQPTFGIMCKTAGQLGPNNQLKRFDQVRPLGVFVTSSSGNYQIQELFDPTKLLLGRPLSAIRPSIDGKGYFGTTSNVSGESQIRFTPGKSGEWSDWQIAIKGSDFETTKLVAVGTCMLMDGATRTDFDQIAASFGSKK